MASASVSAASAQPASVQAPSAPAGLTAHAVLAPLPSELALLLFAGAMGGVAILLGGWLETVMNFVIPAALIGTQARAIITMLRKSVATVWTPLLWMRAAVFFYGGFGTIVTLLANDESRNYIELFFSFYAADILVYNVVLDFFMLSVLTTIYVVTGRVTGSRADHDGLMKLTPSSLDLSIVGTAFLIVGSVANFVFILPYQFGLVRTTFPAIINEVGQSAFIGLFLTTVSLARKRSPLLIPVVLLGLFYALLGLLSFSKSSTVMPIVMLGLAYFYLRPNLFRVAVLASLVVSVFFMSAPLVDQGRMAMSVRYGGIDAPAPIFERMEILAGYFDERVERPGDENVNYAALRFSYVNVGTYVVSQWNEGQPGDTYRNALAVFIPRSIWPDKPIITEIARELSFAATGNWNSSVAPGIAPESYWNGGWLGVILVGMVTGLVVGIWSVYSVSVQTSGAWHLFVIVLLGVRMGSRFDGFFVVDIIGPVAFGLVGHYLLTIGNAAIARRNANLELTTGRT